MKKDAKGAGPKVVTANALDSGLVVFRTVDGRWSTDIAEAEVAETKEAAEALLAQGEADSARNLVVDVYLVAMTESDDGRLVPVLLREAIRAARRPTIVMPGEDPSVIAA
ncbi:DUF2849 domain-containing protein [Chelatococcus daeguensis]|uniref:DUF2849 domain-containing protein n=2 Tax=Chelatococcus TaxID=28209 RepID=A0AAC9JU09_9HYPH|nr:MULTISPECIES: DUF2849 domain-containing protein [Chelatococcus]APF38590.1 hypothetical protein BOQ54_15745 [Chelatococcus daeguensis]KZE36281.1 hypothetical protein AVW15_10920 [Chelatococcus daeguensis]MBM3084242.1 DUF2849 domain-containing protein [Chelatococcus daeguensis]CUA89529.1 Protein of unknown function (DUF2849) [Chelatococcus sambhunathii]